MEFSQYLKRITSHVVLAESERRVVFTFGRMNPPTKGHKQLVDTVTKLAGKDDHYIFVSQSYDGIGSGKKVKDPNKRKNPLKWEDKIEFLKKCFPGANISTEQTTKNPYSAMEWLAEQGYGTLVMVAGSDRLSEYERMKKYASDLNVTLELESSGERDPDSEGVAGLSGTKAREAARTNNIGKFRAATGWSGDLAEDMLKKLSSEIEPS